MMTSPTLDLNSTSPAFQAGFAAGQKDARQHRRRNRVLDDIVGLMAFADDAALTFTRANDQAKSQPARAELAAGFAEGYVRAYRQGTGQ
jgi:hypothetical protein